MSKSAEEKMMLTVGKKNTRIGSVEFEEMFPIVDIENVSLEDDFMQYEPETNREERLKKSIIEAKRIGMKNFRIPAIDPSFDDGEMIMYCAGKVPAVGKTAEWWDENASMFMPEKNSRLRNDLEEDVFLGVLIKYLIEQENYEVKEAWEAICVNSKKMGNYYGMGVKQDFELTGSRKIGKWFDLANTYKIVKKRESSSFVLFGGCYRNCGNYKPLAEASNIDIPNLVLGIGVGALVLDK